LQLIIDILRDGGDRAARAVSERLRGHGLQLESEQAAAVGEQVVRERYRAEAPELALERIELALNGLDEVREILDLWSPEAEEPALRRLLDAWPRVLPVLDELERSLPAPRRQHELTRLGVRAGARMAFDDPAIRAAQDVAQGLEAAVPRLEGVAEGTVEAAGAGGIYRARNSVLCRRRLNMMFAPFDDEAEGCHFLTGLLCGMLRQVPALPRVAVRETRCRALGDPECTFEARAHAV